jgi:threonylcarbamoyladenosine tRNA methylthiotransferase MtaB
MKRKVAFKTLGCRLNQFETDSLVTDFYKAGYEIVDFSQKADVYVVNTCTVTNQSDRKSKYTINQAVKFGDNESLTIVTGCMVTSQKEYLENRNDITYVVDNKRKGSVVPLVDAHFQGEVLHPADLKQDLFNFSVVERGFHTRSSIKIQDGCDNFCTFCIVPKVRGRATSRPVNEILENVQRSLELGNKEIVLTGVNISRYDYEKTQFEDLVEKIINLPGDFRVRISSIEPEGFTGKFVSLFENPKLCPHLHLCLQSGSDKVLMRMRRFYTVDKYMAIINQFRSTYSNFNLTTDVIVGFPGETEDEFRETCEIVREVGFSHIHTFKYSRRTGTRADRMEDQIAEKIKTERSEVIRSIADEMKLNYRKQFVRKKQRLLIERNGSKGGSRGYGEHYLPLVVKNKKLERNAFFPVRLTNILDDTERTMVAEVITRTNV